MKVGTMKIAEIGWNFMGDMDLAEKMIVAAGRSGASHVKFQYWQEKNLKEGPWDTDGRRDIYKSAQLDQGRIQHLNAVAVRVGLVPFYSVFSLSELETLANISRKLIKIPSHEIYNLDLIKKAIDEFETVILSTGACSEQELLDVANLVDNVETTIVVMHCVSSYPCEPSSLNLPRLQVLETLFPSAALGLSDHTSSTVTPAVAVGFKVSVVEKHFTIDNNLPGRDNKFALLPDQFKEMVQNFDEAAAACRFHGVGHQETEKDIVTNYRGRWG